MVNDRVTTIQYSENSPQIVECMVVLKVLEEFSEALNIVSDSLYVVNAVKILEVAGVIKPASRLAEVFVKIQNVLLKRINPVYITHIGPIQGFQDPCHMAIIWQIKLLG